MATSMDQIFQYSCLENPSDREAWQATGHRPQPTGSQRVGHYWRDPAYINTSLCLPVGANKLAQVRVEMKVVHLLGQPGRWRHQMCRDTDCLHRRSCGPIRVFFWASGSWQSEGLFGQSFSIALPIQALRGLPCLGSFSVVRCSRHTEGPTWLGS